MSGVLRRGSGHLRSPISLAWLKLGGWQKGSLNMQRKWVKTGSFSRGALVLARVSMGVVEEEGENN